MNADQEGQLQMRTVAVRVPISVTALTAFGCWVGLLNDQCVIVPMRCNGSPDPRYAKIVTTFEDATLAQTVNKRFGTSFDVEDQVLG